MTYCTPLYVPTPTHLKLCMRFCVRCQRMTSFLKISLNNMICVKNDDTRETIRTHSGHVAVTWMCIYSC